MTMTMWSMMTNSLRCPTCGGCLYRSDDGPRCLQCGRSPEPPRPWEPPGPKREIVYNLAEPRRRRKLRAPLNRLRRR
jgi:hypothetical protein